MAVKGYKNIPFISHPSVWVTKVWSFYFRATIFFDDGQGHRSRTILASAWHFLPVGYEKSLPLARAAIIPAAVTDAATLQIIRVGAVFAGMAAAGAADSHLTRFAFSAAAGAHSDSFAGAQRCTVRIGFANIAGIRTVYAVGEVAQHAVMRGTHAASDRSPDKPVAVTRVWVTQDTVAQGGALRYAGAGNRTVRIGFANLAGISTEHAVAEIAGTRVAVVRSAVA